MREVPVKKVNKGDPFIKLTLVQLVVCAVVAGVFFGMLKFNSGLFGEMKDEFLRLTEKSWDLSTGVHMWRQSVTEATEAESSENSSEQPSADSTSGGEDNSQSDEKATSSAGDGETGNGVTTENVDATVSAGGVDLDEAQAADCLNFAFYEAGDIPCMPVSGIITSSFGERVHPIYGTEGFHSGTDIAADEGTPILAALDGTVIETGVGDSAGKYVKIIHENGFCTLYCHCSAINTEKGVKVRKGDVIAFVGETGLATGPHLHFEVQRDGEKLDPAFLLENAEVLV